VLGVENLEVSYGRIRALRGVSLSVPEGGSVAVLGPNGAGKTSLLKALSGAVTPAAGRVLWRGRDLRGTRPHRVVRLGLAHVPEGRGILSPLTVEENLLMGAYGNRGDTSGLLREMLDLFPSLERRLKTAAGSLSGGEQQMLSVARGLMSRPSLLMIDEPSMGLAPAVADDVLRGLRAVNAQGTAVLLVEQNAALALRLVTDVVVLSHGEVQAAGPAAELEHDLLAAYTT
jgi:branched-chain amino acid transport system ATP-binding protein